VGPGPTRRTTRLSDASYLVNVLTFAGDVAMARLRERRAADRAPRLVALGEQSPEIVVTRHFLQQFQRAVEAKQARFVAAFVPQPGELGEARSPSDNATRNERGYREAFGACVAPSGIETLDLLPAFLEAKRAHPRARLTFPHDQHWTALGHEVAGRAIADFILRSRRARPPSGP
jgi:hypothetical protein